jgi:hypothetical protein
MSFAGRSNAAGLPRGLRLLLVLSAAGSLGLRAQTPPLLAKAFAEWTAGRNDLAFTQETKYLADDGTVKQERMERYDPSLPDSRRWMLVTVDGQPATDAQRKKWETKKNGKPRKNVVKSPSEYLDLEDAKPLDETDKNARFEISLRPEAARLLAVEKINVDVTVDKASGSIARVTAGLREPMRVLLGLARITDLAIDVRLEVPDAGSGQDAGEVQSGSTASITLSKLGTPMEYNWSDFKRVSSFAAGSGPQN